MAMLWDAGQTWGDKVSTLVTKNKMQKKYNGNNAKLKHDI